MIKTLSEKIGECHHFTWSEALFLPKWGVHVFPENGIVYFNIIRTAQKMDMIRDFFNKKIIVTSWYRPKNYNELIGGAKKSSHLYGLACDFMIQGVGSDLARKSLFSKLKTFNIRMESLNTPHVHIDLNCDGSETNEQRFFSP